MTWLAFRLYLGQSGVYKTHIRGGSYVSTTDWLIVTYTASS